MSVLEGYGIVLLALLGFTAVRAGLPKIGKDDDRIGTAIAAAGIAVGVGLVAIAQAMTP